MGEYLKMPWSMADTIRNLETLKEHLQERVIIRNLHGKGEKDAEEIAFDFDRAIATLKKQIPQKPVKTDNDGYRYTDTYRCPACGRNFSGTGIADYCYHCGQALEWGNKDLVQRRMG